MSQLQVPIEFSIGHICAAIRWHDKNDLLPGLQSDQSFVESNLYLSLMADLSLTLDIVNTCLGS